MIATYVVKTSYFCSTLNTLLINNKVYNNVYDGYSQTPKIYGMLKTVELVQLYPFGVGLGMYGTKYSANSNIYNELNFHSETLYLPYS